MLPEFDPRWLRGSRDDCEICEFFPRRVRPRLSLPGRVRYLLDTVGNWSTNRSEEHTSELQSHVNLVCRLLLEKKKKKKKKKIKKKIRIRYKSRCNKEIT